jgi:hypothetical protein
MRTGTAFDPDQPLADLSPANRRAVHDAVISSALEGWTPDGDAVAALAGFAVGATTIEEYRAQVLKKTTARS